MTDLAEIKVMSRTNFDNVASTDDSKLYFVEDGAVNPLSTSGTITLSDNSINKITPSAAVTFSLPSGNTATFHQILVQVNLSTVYTITLGTNYYFNKKAPDLSAAGKYNLLYEYDSELSAWVVGCVSKGAAS